MKSRRTVLGHLLSIALALTVAAPLAAQHSESMHVNVNVPDSVAHMVDRENVEHARFAIMSRDGASMLLLMDTTIVAQMTDHGLARMSSREAVDTIQGAGNRLLARMGLGAWHGARPARAGREGQTRRVGDRREYPDPRRSL